ncbi:MAG TPA: tail fiber protein [Gemmataceae bacterium]|nr:tail fiber protein [Gemmataceae bacterium]
MSVVDYSPKIDSIFDLSPKALGELKAWLEPWWLGSYQSNVQTGAASIPGEIRMWSGASVPPQDAYGLWVWADGAVYATNSYPLAAANIATAWRTFAGASDPGVGNFRVPDLRGVGLFGMDAMPGGSRANRTTRAAAASLAGKSGEEYHTLSVGEMPAHSHNVPGTYNGVGGSGGGVLMSTPPINDSYPTDSAGSGSAHENMPPSVFIPFIVKLDG